MTNSSYKYITKFGEKTVEKATMFEINTAIMRCLTKNLALFGLGINIYAGEDLPLIDDDGNIAQKKIAHKTTTAPVKSTPTGSSIPAWFNKKELEMCIAEDNAFSKEAIEQWALDNGYKLS
jgi:hypothetical protein